MRRICFEILRPYPCIKLQVRQEDAAGQEPFEKITLRAKMTDAEY